MQEESYYVCVRCGGRTNNPIVSNVTREAYCSTCFRTIFNPYIIARCPKCKYEVKLLKYDMPLSGIPLCKLDGEQMKEVGE